MRSEGAVRPKQKENKGVPRIGRLGLGALVIGLFLSAAAFVTARGLESRAMEERFHRDADSIISSVRTKMEEFAESVKIFSSNLAVDPGLDRGAFSVLGAELYRSAPEARALRWVSLSRRNAGTAMESSREPGLFNKDSETMQALGWNESLWRLAGLGRSTILSYWAGLGDRLPAESPVSVAYFLIPVSRPAHAQQTEGILSVSLDMQGLVRRAARDSGQEGLSVGWNGSGQDFRSKASWTSFFLISPEDPDYTVTILDRPWSFTVHADRSYLSRIQNTWYWAVLPLGLVFSVLGMLILNGSRTRSEQRNRQAIEESERNFESFFNSIHELLFVIDDEGLILACNQSASEGLSMASTSIVGTRLSGYIAHADGARIFLENILGSGLAQHCILHSEAERDLIVDMHALRGRWNGAEVRFVLARDISDLQAERDKLLTIFQENPTPMVLSDFESQVVIDANRAFFEVLGLDSQEVIGTRTIDLGLLAPDFDTSPFENTLASKGTIRNLPLKLRARSGVVLSGAYSGHLIRVGNFTYILSVWIDLSKEENARRELEEAVAAAESANRAKSHFLANMSHEIRTPMNGIIGMVDLALMNELEQETRGYIENIRYSAHSLLRIIDDILDLSKIEAGKISLELRDFDLHDLIEKIARSMIPRTDAKGLELTLRIAPGVPRIVKGDQLRVRQILNNLIDNAIKFTSSGELDLAVESIDEKRIRISVRDTGIGIADDEQTRVFESFTQADSSTTRRYGGSGLGLSISRTLAKLMGGDIGLVSRPGTGSTFTVTMELGTSELNSTPEPVVKELKSSAILIITESSGIQKNLALSCADLGYPVLVMVERTGIGDLGARLGKDTPRLIIYSPEIGNPSEQTLAALRGAGKSPCLVLCSAPDRKRIETFTAGSDLRIAIKPIGKEGLRKAIQSALDTYDAESDPRDETPLPRTLRSLRKRILVAEDNETNFLVIEKFLSMLDCEVERAENGNDAVLIQEKKPADLILMDIHMPGMDGMDASRAIRLREQGSKSRVPIIALTADAMREDREKCLQAGMDDYLAKPFELRDLEIILEKYSGSTRDPSFFDSEAFWNAMGQDGALAVEVLASFRSSAPDMVRLIADSLAAGRYDTAARTAHSLKGSALTIRSVALTREADAIERLALRAASGGVSDPTPEGDSAALLDVLSATVSRCARLAETFVTLTQDAPIK